VQHSDPKPVGTLSVAEAARRLGIGGTTAYQLIARGEFPIPVQRIGRQMKVLRYDLEVYLGGPLPVAVTPGRDTVCMDRYEYRILSGAGELHTVEESLNAAAHEGFRLVDTAQGKIGSLLILERPVQEGRRDLDSDG
jgi:excisionase family DNA binding protein